MRLIFISGRNGLSGAAHIPTAHVAGRSNGAAACDGILHVKKPHRTFKVFKGRRN